MAEYVTEDEQLQALKKWWRDNGRFTILVIVIGIAGYFGWQFWQNYQQQQAESAAALYSDLLEAVTTAPGEPLTEEKRTTAHYLINQLKAGHSSSLYALNAAMYGAKIAVEANELDKAAELLQWALDQSDSDEADNVLRLRLARVMNALTDYDQALAYSQYDVTDDFMPLFAAVRGDAYLGKGDISAAKAAYQLALDKASPIQYQQHRQLVSMKIADLSTSGSGVEEPSAENKEPSAQNKQPSAQSDKEPSAQNDIKSSAQNKEPSVQGKGVAPSAQSEQPPADNKQSVIDGRGVSE